MFCHVYCSFSIVRSICGFLSLQSLIRTQKRESQELSKILIKDICCPASVVSPGFYSKSRLTKIRYINMRYDKQPVHLTNRAGYRGVNERRDFITPLDFLIGVNLTVICLGLGISYLHPASTHYNMLASSTCAGPG
jgi:hypothetical protein